MKISIRFFGTIISYFFVCTFISNAQQLQRHQVIAAYIYNFAKNVQWQNEEQIKEFRFHIITADKKIINELSTLSNGKSIRNKSIKISSSATIEGIGDAHLIFIGKDKEEYLTKLFDTVEGSNVLCVSDGYRDKRLIMINFTESENGTVRFEINKANIINQHLRIMEDMILLGGTEIDVAELYRKGQQSLRSLQKHSENIENNLLKLETTIIEKSKEIEIQKDSLAIQTQNIKLQQNILDLQSRDLENHGNEIASQIKEIQNQHSILSAQSVELQRQKNALKEGSDILQDQKKKIEYQQKTLEEKGVTIHKQQNYLYLLIVIVILTVLLVFAIFNSYKDKKRLSKELERKVEERTNELRISNEQLQIELTEHKRTEDLLKESVTKFKTLFEINPDAIFITDADTLEIYDCNQVACVMNGYSHEELIGRSINILHLEQIAKIVDNADARHKFIEHLQHHNSVTEESIHRRKDGTLFPIETSMCLLTLEGRQFVMGIDRDITERKRAENELKKYHGHLEEMVHDRTAELKIAKERAESADHFKSAFLATMSHELRTPLNSIIGFTGILMKGIAGPLNNEQQKQLGMAKGSAHHLLDLINDVLDISKIEAGQLVVSIFTFDYAKTLKNIVATVQPLAEKKEIKIQLDISNDIIEINSDERRVGQVLLNLINNAIKFTDHGTIKIDCQVTDGSVVTKIIDTGIGIKHEDMHKLFKPFIQIDTGLTRNHDGTGLGLSISQKLIDKLNGTITVESELGIGSTFTVILPLQFTDNKTNGAGKFL